MNKKNRSSRNSWNKRIAGAGSIREAFDLLFNGGLPPSNIQTFIKDIHEIRRFTKVRETDPLIKKGEKIGAVLAPRTVWKSEIQDGELADLGSKKKVFLKYANEVLWLALVSDDTKPFEEIILAMLTARQRATYGGPKVSLKELPGIRRKMALHLVKGLGLQPYSWKEIERFLTFLGVDCDRDQLRDDLKQMRAPIPKK